MTQNEENTELSAELQHSQPARYDSRTATASLSSLHGRPSSGTTRLDEPTSNAPASAPAAEGTGKAQEPGGMTPCGIIGGVTTR